MSDESDPDLDGRMAVMRLATDILDGKSGDDFATFTLGPAAAVQGLGYAVGRWVEMCRQYAMLLAVAEVDEEHAGTLAPAGPEAARAVDGAVRRMIQAAMAETMLSAIEPGARAPGDAGPRGSASG